MAKMTHMTFLLLQEQFFKIMATFFALIIFFLYGSLTGYNPIIGLVLAAGSLFLLAYYFHPDWFAYLYIVIVSFAALFHLPVTDNGFSSAVAITLVAFPIGVLGALLAKAKALLSIFFDRMDQVLPILFFLLMIVSMMNSRAMGFSAKQIQQFLYILVAYYFLHLTIRDRRTFQKAFRSLFLGGVCVGILGMVEVILQTPIYFLLGNKSLLGASVSDVLLNAKIGRINGLIGDAPFHGVYMAMTAAISLYFVFRPGNRFIRFLCLMVFLLSVFNVLGTGSRGAFMALLLALLVFWFIAEIPHKTAIMASVLLLGFLLVLAMVFLIPNLKATRAFTMSEDTSDTAEMRWKNIPVALKMFADHPIIGNGPDGFVINYTRYAQGLSNLASREKTLKTHNTPLQILAEYGMAGIVLFGLIIFMVLKRMTDVMRNQRALSDRMIAGSIVAAISAYLFFMITSNTLLDKYFWLLITLAQIHYSLCKTESERPVSS